ncbi:MAG: DUF3883 domain-containing protein [Demequinaceae bacterium]|nr:DUF3883 domain-containing protein [Demequinaceae bacterium]
MSEFETPQPDAFAALAPGQRVSAPSLPGVVTVVAIERHGADVVNVVYRDSEGKTGEALLFRKDEASLRQHTGAGGNGQATFDADPHAWRLAAEALRIKNAALYDPMLAVTTSQIDPLPHQIRAVYGELLQRTPLRYLLADDPGAGKTIMAGLYLKELLLRGDLDRCLIVPPGSLVEQWQDELREKFGLHFDLLSNDLIENATGGNVFDQHPYLIARMDHLARRDDLHPLLEQVEWDVIVVDEAHRMSANYYGNELKTTLRYQLGQILSTNTRHFLLMTATPHAGDDQAYQLFLSLLDPDRFEGHHDPKAARDDARDIMRRMIKEDLLTMEGKRLFPERFAYTANYMLSPAERDLYEQVSAYVRDEMNRADRLKDAGEGRRGNRVGFALTVLQRRLASSPEAILRSLERRKARLESQRDKMRKVAQGSVLESWMEDEIRSLDSAMDPSAFYEAMEDFTSDEVEVLEEEIMDSATAAMTAEELAIEISSLERLVELARRVYHAGTDAKWQQLSAILGDKVASAPDSPNVDKLIVFTEHRDTLTYLVKRIGDFLGRGDAVVTIHGGTRREDRRSIRESFSKDPKVRILVATDAAGEGINLQRAHLMVNYDLPWNPNRIEQRFGRIHRIGQTEVCHLWNLVAAETREGQVYQTLLEKIAIQREAYGGKVFDVIGNAFEGRPLEKLMMEAIRYGDQPEVRARLEMVIDAAVSLGIPELIKENSLNSIDMPAEDVEKVRREMDEAQARRLQPHHIQAFFRTAFEDLGGRMVERESRRFEITRVPAALIDASRRTPTRTPLISHYERVTFDLDKVEGPPRADLLAPGHPLLDTVGSMITEKYGDTLRRGTIWADPDSSEPRLFVALTEEIRDGSTPQPHTISRAFSFMDIHPSGEATSAGSTPYLDLDVPSEAVTTRGREIAQQDWLVAGPEATARAWAAQHSIPLHLDAVERRMTAVADKTRELVSRRLNKEMKYWDSYRLEALDKRRRGVRVRYSPEYAEEKSRDLEGRLDRRLKQIEASERLTALPATVAGVALVLPPDEVALPPEHARETEEVERRAVDATLAAERALDRVPTEMRRTNKGYDIQSSVPDGPTIFIEVKGRLAGATEVTVTKSEVLLGKNAADNYRLALVSVHPDSPHLDAVRYVTRPFDATPMDDPTVTRVTYGWKALWDAAALPF